MKVVYYAGSLRKQQASSGKQIGMENSFTKTVVTTSMQITTCLLYTSDAADD